MVGYLKPNFKRMSAEEKKVYKSFYCGVCKALKKQFGYIGVASLNYEITSFLVLLNGLKSEKQKIFHGSCVFSPFAYISYIDYFQGNIVTAANLSFLIAHYEIKDNLQDGDSCKWRIIDKCFVKRLDKSALALGEDYYNIKHCISLYYQYENDSTVTFLEVLEMNGSIVEKILLPIIKSFELKTTELLIKLANLIGKWIYLIDACDDFQDDIHKNNFNPLFLLEDTSDINYVLHEIEKNILLIISSLQIECYESIIWHIFVEVIQETSKRMLLKVTKNFK